MVKNYYSFIVLLGTLVLALPVSAMSRDTSPDLKRHIARKGPPPKPPTRRPAARGRGVGVPHEATPPVPSRGRVFRGRGGLRGRPTPINDRLHRRLQRAQKQENCKSKLPLKLDHHALNALITSSQGIKAPVKIRAGKDAVRDLERLKASSSPKAVTLPSGVKVTIKHGLEQLQNAKKSDESTKLSARKKQVIDHSYSGSTAKSEGSNARGVLVEYELYKDEKPVMKTIKKVMPKDKGFKEIERQVPATLILSITIKE